MAKTRFVIRGLVVKTQCSECEEIISACAYCGKEFKDNQAIQRINNGEFHA